MFTAQDLATVTGTRPVAKGKIDWLKMEDEIRTALQTYKSHCAEGFSSPAEHGIMADKVMKYISDSVGVHTGRGFEL